jgi:hypothetical protein
MPICDFRCESCGFARPLSISSDVAQSLAFVCRQCGGTMHQVPVRAVEFMAAGGHPAAVSSRGTLTAKFRHHDHAKYQSVKLMRVMRF